MKHEYALLLSVVGGWLLRGLFSAYQNRDSLNWKQRARMVLLGR